MFVATRYATKTMASSNGKGPANWQGSFVLCSGYGCGVCIVPFPLRFQTINMLKKVWANIAPHRVKDKINSFPTS